MRDTLFSNENSGKVVEKVKTETRNEDEGVVSKMKTVLSVVCVL